MASDCRSKSETEDEWPRDASERIAGPGSGGGNSGSTPERTFSRLARPSMRKDRWTIFTRTTNHEVACPAGQPMCGANNVAFIGLRHRPSSHPLRASRRRSTIKHARSREFEVNSTRLDPHRYFPDQPVDLAHFYRYPSRDRVEAQHICRSRWRATRDALPSSVAARSNRRKAESCVGCRFEGVQSRSPRIRLRATSIRTPIPMRRRPASDTF